ncbi:Uncharacterized protein Adt_02569 [Abeliophyllum distichum]|uniref:Reverse transcriptase domain-containing protein n=1 Tax=Abeliophyllum distichum TaxID=126358 RepID=A0ABD1VW07_9LAMI
MATMEKKMMDTIAHNQTAHAIQTPTLECDGCGANHSTGNCPLLTNSSTSIEQPCYAQNHPSNKGNYRATLRPTQESSLKQLLQEVGVQWPEIEVKRNVVIQEKTPSIDDEQVDQSKVPHVAIQEKDLDTPHAKATPHVRVYVPPIPFLQRMKKYKLDKQFEKFLEVFKKLLINIPFVDTLAQMPSYAKFMKEILSNKKKLEERETVMLTEECNAILQNKLPHKLKDPGSFTIPLYHW